MSQPIKKMGQEAVRILIDQIENKDQGVINVLLKAKLETK
jgi:DNA-binding LacI/PurR family transcriptional regulator